MKILNLVVAFTIASFAGAAGLQAQELPGTGEVSSRSV